MRAGRAPAQFRCIDSGGLGRGPYARFPVDERDRPGFGRGQRAMEDPMKPPFRADMVGSLLRTEPLKDARAKREKGQITADQLKKVEDEEIRKIVRKQEEIGLQLATDGEFRRSWWHFDFFWGLQGCERVVLDHGIQFHGIQTKPESLKVTGKLDFPARHPMLEHFKFLKANTKAVPKMTIPSPAVMHFRGGRAAISKTAYPEMDAYFDDLGKLYGKAIKAFYDAGCRYLQLDDTVWAYLCSKDQMEQARQRGEDADKLAGIYAKTINAALKSKPADMTITTHVCRGNFRSTWISEGGYEPVAEVLLGGIDYDGYFLEYDTERAGGLEPLRFVPKGKKRVVVGLVTSKSGTLEKKDDIKRRLDEAAKYAPMDQLCLSPQCGFASTEEGNVLTEDQQWAKLRMIVDISREVWK
jgi:5-methyltetrahydropteroyltriglutamate--homocysteine methyltransferase